ncbi:type II toxin-antitoxin system RelE/ParE family toxin [uncultured Nostoc sp.]|uniref:type II toxin-antitoxin system RelE/ParE family toxin n=1 Tax=uncultured Nostoc sp. TaxID=340711 RepID=UPI0035CA0535
MAFQVEITPIAETQIKQAYRWYRERNPEFADRWFRGLMNAIATLQEKPQRCALAVEHEIFPEEVRQLLYGKSKKVGFCKELLAVTIFMKTLKYKKSCQFLFTAIKI